VPRVCTVCTRPDRPKIDAAIVTRRDSMTGIARSFAVGADALARHAKTHLLTTLVKAGEAAELTQADDLVAQLAEVRRAAWAAKTAAEKDGDTRALLAALKIVLDHVDLCSRIEERRQERDAKSASGRAPFQVNVIPFERRGS
jgi:hypothetical protein